MAKSKLSETNGKLARGVANGYQKMEHGVVDGYKKIESSVVGGFTKMTDKFVDYFLTKAGETVEDAKKRLAREQSEREAAGKAGAKKRAATQQTGTGMCAAIAETGQTIEKDS